VLPVIILPSAEADLEDIRNTLGELSLTAFDRLLTALERRFQVLSQFPEAGKAVELPIAGLRVVFVNGYAAYHKPTEVSVQIIRIVDGRRDQSALWG
jgi:plasmid stabilization system protein ParE